MTGKPTEEECADDTEPLPDEEYPFDNNTLHGQRTCSQICAYAGATMALQFWTYLFIVVIFGSYVWLLQWDRSSVIISCQFNYAEHPLIVFQFYKCFAQLNPAQHGHDLRISIPMHAQGQVARKAFRQYVPEFFIIRAPDWHQGRYSPFRRVTQHGMAYCELNKMTFFYKDYWREDVPHTISESEVYYLLTEHEIPFVAQMELGGDNGFETIGHDYVLKAWAHTYHQICCLIGHLIVLVTKGHPLESFETTKQLVSCVTDAMEAHQKAYELAGLLHRDISVGNIMITLDQNNQQGILIDWDHCVLVSQDTWQFVSAHLLDNPNAEHSVIDNRELALYVLVWVALRNLRHSLPLELLKDILSTLDKYVTLPLQHEVGGRHK
ncbi:hypothetical protein F5146DRAFT_924956 [Armillaria mellea]|nr:hypothetical protein F5146DRAFT_924956 [Armillaria mellea]